MKTSVSKLMTIAVLSALAGAMACSPSGGKPSGKVPPGSPVSVAPVIQKDMPLEIAAVGRVEAISTVAVKAQVAGEVTGIYFKEGQNVRKGERLLTIDPRPFEIVLKQAESLLEKDRALLRNAQVDAARYEGLVRKDYVTKEQYDALVANKDVLAAAVKGDEAAVAGAELNLEYATIRSPIDGRTGNLLIDRGNIIKSIDNSPAVVIEQITPIYVAFSVPEQDLARLRDFMSKGPLRAIVAPGGGGQPEVSGALTFVDSAVDPTTGTIALKATFDNRDGVLWPGQFLNVRLVLTTEKDVAVVPSVAVQTGQSGQYVYVVKEDLTAELRPVKVGRTLGEESIIAEGLKPGERVVTDGQLRLAAGARVEIKAGR